MDGSMSGLMNDGWMDGRIGVIYITILTDVCNAPLEQADVARTCCGHKVFRLASSFAHKSTN